MSYLEGYGVTEARQEKRRLYVIGLVLLLVFGGVILYFWQRDRAEIQKVDGFLAALRNRDYKAAYAYWGCTDQTPCKGYPFEKFMEDWGPSSPFANASAVKKSGGQHCTNGRIEVLRAPGDHDTQLLVQRASGQIGFAPWPIDADPPETMTIRLRRMMRDLVGDCAPPPMKVP